MLWVLWKEHYSEIFRRGEKYAAVVDRARCFLDEFGQAYSSRCVPRSIVELLSTILVAAALLLQLVNNADHAEMLGLLLGVELARRYGLNRFGLESDRRNATRVLPALQIQT